eukprot:Hpha_TRINITY_DN15359_c3_g5::TRINITY_DN15359_c3_g5_i1::g.88228::m.88228
MAPDATWVYAPETISRIQKGKNKAEILAWLGGLKNDFDGFKLVPSLLIGEGDVVMAKTRSTATHRLVGPYAQDYMFTFIFAPGSLQVTKIEEFVDSRYTTRFFEKAMKLAKAKSKL